MATNPLEMSDEDIMNQSAPPAAEEAAAGDTAATETATETETEEQPDENGEPAGGADADTDAGAGDADEGSGDAETGDGGDEPANGDQPADGAEGPATDKTDPKPGADDGVSGADAKGAVEAAPATVAVPTEFKANGKTVQVKNEGEATKLMQLGANYTKQMQALAPHRKVLMMLQNNDIDEDKLSFLIDLDKKNPEAIKQLIKDAGIDPLEIDTSKDPEYIAGNHQVTDEQARFRTTVDEISSMDGGKETILMVTKWDQDSKDAVWASPEIMTAIHEQRESGVFNLISDEVERRMTLGDIPAGTPFLEAYKNVGMEMATAATNDSSGSTGAGVTTTGAATPGKVAVTTRAAAPKPSVANGDKAAAASLTRENKGTAKAVVNVLAQNDDDFLKSMEGRV